MDLSEIRQQTCQICGAETLSESRNNKHSNGHYNESRTFGCGATLNWSPNFMDFHNNVTCPMSEENKLFNKKRGEARNRLLKFVEKLDVDDAWKESVSYHRVW